MKPGSPDYRSHALTTRLLNPDNAYTMWAYGGQVQYFQAGFDLASLIDQGVLIWSWLPRMRGIVSSDLPTLLYLIYYIHILCWFSEFITTLYTLGDLWSVPCYAGHRTYHQHRKGNTKKRNDSRLFCETTIIPLPSAIAAKYHCRNSTVQ